jgi:outer membrane protein assembly factor BamB
MIARLLVALAIAMVMLGPTAPAHGAEACWPEFRGPGGLGQATDPDLPLRWSEDRSVRWKTAVPGRGWSSPVVADGRIWITTAEEHQADDAQRAALLKTVENVPVAEEMVAFASVTLAAVELDLQTGAILRRIELFHPVAPPPIHGLNSYASPTPVLDGGRVYCHFGAYGTACIDAATGEVKWRRKFEIDHIVGPGSSPVVCGKVLIIPCDGSDRQFIAGLDVDTGDTAWLRDRPPIREQDPDQRKAFCTPLVIEAAGRRQAVIPGAQWFVAYDPATGEEIWRIDYDKGFSNVARPVFDGQMLYLCTGYGGRQLWAVRPDGVGDVGATHVAWRQSQQVPTMSSPAVSQGRLYLVTEGGVASCLDAKTGDTVWRKRLGGNYSASPLVGAGRVYFCSQEGRTTVLRDGPAFELLAENELDGMLMASPAAVDGDLLLRTDTHLYRIGGGE